PAPPAPAQPRPADELVRECGGAGWLAWLTLQSARLWSAAAPDQRASLFHPASAPRLRDSLPAAAGADGELAAVLHALLDVCAAPASATAATVAAACEGAMRWAVVRGHRETAIQFAEAAAAAEPESAMRAYVAGRLNRDELSHDRATVWFRRAMRLARLAHSQIEFAIVQLGWGVLEQDRGSFANAEKLFRSAARGGFRNGRRSLAGAANHQLFNLTGYLGRMDEALESTSLAAALYPARHPRLPNLALDVALLWMDLEYFSSALYLLEKVLPRLIVPSSRRIAFAALARCYAVVRDRIKWARASEAALKIPAGSGPTESFVLYYLAESERSFERWDQAVTLALQVIAHEQSRGGGYAAARARALVQAERDPGSSDRDVIPAPNDKVEIITQTILKKLSARVGKPLNVNDVLFPELYPTA
ncbi:MAG: hypothetical protein JWM27_3952, partial [Gemmatimonadetes bacterium]|nr:hypothetical protein [Gemmatimonadota bacterium]